MNVKFIYIYLPLKLFWIKNYQPVLEMTSNAPTKGGDSRNVIKHCRWQRHFGQSEGWITHAMFDVTGFPAFVRASDFIFKRSVDRLISDITGLPVKGKQP